MNESTKSRSCLITGATGFIGSHLTVHLLNRGWNVHVIVRPTSKLEGWGQQPAPVTIHEHDGTQESMLEIVRSAKPEVVFHLASLVLSSHQPHQVEPLIQSNVAFGTQLLEAIRVEGVDCFVNTATYVQHYEQRDYSPVNLYAATKQAFESILAYYTEAHSIHAITLTLFDTYGPRDSRRKIFRLLAEAAETGQRLDMTLGVQWLDVVHVNDVMRGYEIAAERLLNQENKGFTKYMLSSGKRHQLKELVELYMKVTGKYVNAAWGAIPYRPRDVMQPWNRGEPLPGWKAEIGLEEGLRTLHQS